MSKNYVCMCQCPLCGKDSGVAIDKRLKRRYEYSDRIPLICDECNNFLEKGALLYIEVRDGETGDNPHRTGNSVWLTKEFRERNGIKGQVYYIEASKAKEIGLPMGKEIDNR